MKAVGKVAEIAEQFATQGVDYVMPSPATHSILTELKAGGIVCQIEFGRGKCRRHAL